MSLSEYLAKNYLSTPQKKSKKEKKERKSRKEKSLIIEDQALSGHNDDLSDAIGHNDEKEEREPVKVTVPKTKGWKVVGTDEIATNAQVVDNEVKMSSGAKAGLQTAEEVSKQIREKEEREKSELEKSSADNLGKGAETVHRDSSGKKVDIHQIRSENKEKREREDAIKKLQHKKQNMGLIQLLEIEETKKNLEKAAESGLARHADDKELNDELKKREHEDDPLLSFNYKKSKKYVSRTGRKLYKSGFPENRFGILPGWRWDGVDRSNGFEKAWFKKQAQMAEKKTLSYTMEEDY